MTTNSDIFSKVNRETLKWYLNFIKDCTDCFHLKEKDKYECLTKCKKCKRYRGYKPPEKPSVSLYLNETYLDEYREMVLPDLSSEEIEYLQCVLEDIQVEPDLSPEERDLFLEIMSE